MSTTLDEMIDAVAALSIDGVKTVYGRKRPDSLTRELPAMWLQLPRIAARRMTFDVVNTLGGGFTVLGLQVQMVVAIEALSQYLNQPNFDACTAMILALDEALSQADIADSWPGQGSALNIYLDHVPVGEQWYWAVIADIQVTGG